MTIKRSISYFLRYLIIISSLGGCIYGCFTARRDGYSIWYNRLMYFTMQSNIWIGLIHLAIIFLRLFNDKPKKRVVESFYLCKFYFTVSIAMTGIIFCALLGPFADSSYHPWSFYSIIVHAITPILAITEFFLDDYRYNLSFKKLYGVLIAPTVYYALAIILCACRFDYGRGDPFPYFFLDIYSKAGLFGFSSTPYYMGTLWWISIFAIFMLFIGFLFIKIRHSAKLKFK